LVAARAGSARNPKVRTSRITTPTAKPRPEECIHPPGWAQYRLGYEPAGSLRRTFIPDLPLAGPEDSMPGVIKTEMEDRLAVVTINRPEALNALNSAVLRELSMTIEHLSMAADVGAIILTGAGDRAFVAGAGIKEMGGLSALEVRSFSGGGGGPGGTRGACHKPNPAALKGYAP